MMATTTAPSGYLKCNGAAVSRTTYADLFAIIGTTHGEGDGSSTFNVPDLRGEFVRGWDDGRGIDSGRSFASSQSDQNKQHNHTATSTVTDPGHNHVYIDQQAHNEGYRPWKAGDNDCGQRNKNTSNAFTGISVSTSIANSGGGESRPRNIAMMYVIKT